jgi:hypothetical protein
MKSKLLSLTGIELEVIDSGLCLVTILADFKRYKRQYRTLSLVYLNCYRRYFQTNFCLEYCSSVLYK